MNIQSYTKHYYIEADRFVSKIGGGMANINYNIREDHVYGMDINGIADYENKSYQLYRGMMHRHFEYVQVNDEIIDDLCFSFIKQLQEYDEEEKHFFFYHKDHLGSSTQISDRDANIIHHVEYMPSGEQFSEQRDSWATPYKFNSKELDAETGLYYYGARYYTPEIGIWLSVDPLSDKYPHQSNYMYCSGRLVNVIDPDGQDEWEVNPTGEVVWKNKSKETTLYSVDKNGKRNGNQVSLKDDKIMQQLSKDKGVVKRQEDAEGKVYKRGKLRSAVSENKEDMAKSFMFLSKNTNSEWSLYSSLENGESSYGIGTYQFDDVSPSSTHVGMKGEVKSMIHSHPLPNSNESEMGSMHGDKNVARKCSYNYFMFAPKSGNLYQINNKSGKISGKGKISNHKQLMKYF